MEHQITKEYIHFHWNNPKEEEREAGGKVQFKETDTESTQDTVS